MSKEIKEKTRAKAARHHDIVLACIAERLSMIPMTDEYEFHRLRLDDLLAELSRSLKRIVVNGEVEGAA